MSILSSLRRIATSLRRLLLPSYCASCGRRILFRKQFVCDVCAEELAFTTFIESIENRITDRFNAILPHIVHASAMLYYNGTVRAIIHNLKYHNHPYMGISLGRMLGSRLRDSGNYEGIDLVVAVPIHFKRRFFRGYNQADYIARGVASELGIPFHTGAIKRSHHRVSQVRMSHRKRWANTEGVFRVSNPKLFREQNILLIDDVLTTGATTLSCAEAIISAAPSCRIWISAVAASEYEFAAERMRNM